MNFILDLLVIAFIIFFVVNGYKKGFFRSILGFIGFIATVTISIFLTNFSSNLIYDIFIKPSIVNNINNTIYNNYSDLPSTLTGKTLDGLPKLFTDLFFKSGHNSNEIELILKEKSTNSASAISDLFRPLIVHFISTILFFVFVTLLFFLLRFILKHCKITKIPIIGRVDALLGAVLGFFKGIIISAIILNVLLFIVPIFNSESIMFSRENLGDTYISRYIVEPTSNFLEWLFFEMKRGLEWIDLKGKFLKFLI